MDQLKMDKSYAERYVNDGFSGGERKKTEILQMCMLEPKLTMLDEIDSGLDVDASASYRIRYPSTTMKIIPSWSLPTQ